MSPFLPHLLRCNRFDADAALPLLIDGQRIGFIQKTDAPAFAALPGLFDVSERVVRIATPERDPAALTLAMDRAVEHLVSVGTIPRRRGERFAIGADWGAHALFDLDRGAVPYFGARAYGVHLNGLVATANGLSVWIARRAHDREVAPGQLDNLVGGGIAAGYDARGTLIKECEEEASLPAELAVKARPVGVIRYRMSLPRGMRDDVLFLYDLDLSGDFVPRSADGEVESFDLLPVGECLRLVAEDRRFKFNVNLVLIDLGIRYGLIGPEDADYLALNAGLRGGLVVGG